MLPFHPLANLFPLIEGAEFDDLVADIRANGLRERIVMHDGQILDGRNRYRAAIEAGLFDADNPGSDAGEPGVFVFHFGVFNLSYQGDPLAFVLSKNLHRRHLTTSQRGLIGAEIEQLRHGGDRRSKDQDANLHLDRAAAAEQLGVSERTIATGAEVRDHGAPELKDAVRRGHVAVSAAAEIASLPFADQVALIESAGKRAIGAVVKKLRDAKTEAKKEARAGKEAALGARILRSAAELQGDRRYGVILADPPWRFEPRSRATGMDRAPENHYPTLDLAAILALDVPAARDCVLFLWATAPMLPDALRVMDAWGFGYKSHCIWAKPTNGTGYWFRSAHELLLVGVRESGIRADAIPAPAMGTQFPSVVEAKPSRHSEKPDCFHLMIETMFPSLPKLEMFARAAREGWDRWGAEAPQELPPHDPETGEIAPRPGVYLTKAKIADWKALGAIEAGIGVQGPIVDTLEKLGLVWGHDTLKLTAKGAARLAELEALCNPQPADADVDVDAEIPAFLKRRTVAA